MSIKTLSHKLAAATAVLAILTIGFGGQVQAAETAEAEPDQLSLMSAVVAATGQPAHRINIADYQCVEGQHIGWVDCLNVEVDVTGEDGRSYIRHFSGLYVKKAQ